MQRQRKQYAGTFKAKVALETIKGQRTLQEIASSYGVHPNQITKWKKQLVDGAADVFISGRDRSGRVSRQQRSTLCEHSDCYSHAFPLWGPSMLSGSRYLHHCLPSF